MWKVKHANLGRELLVRLGGLLLLAALVGCSKDRGNEDSSAVSCAAAETNCDGICSDTLVSDEHCGGCGSLCSVGSVCDQGACRPIGTTCPAGRTLCGEQCVDLSTSVLHCGACETSCGAGSCDAGACTCAAGEQACGASCADLLTDTAHCGDCDASCQPGQRCAGGACQCEPGLIQCPDGCSDFATDALNCGACGTACQGGRECALGTCACPAGQSICNDVCVNTAEDALNCGECGTACMGGQVCSTGVCACPEGQNICGDTCVDLNTSLDHCGSCDAACAAGQVCSEGACACPEGEEVCGESCVNPLTSDEHCGACDNTCIGGQVCDLGTCECPSGQELCGETCIDTQSDSLNCGGCGVACSLGDSCDAGVCAGGALGDDGCEGMAEGLSLSKLSLYQTIEIPLMESGTETIQRSADVVSGRQSLLRVFVQPEGGFQARQLAARLHLENGDERTVLSTGPQLISGASQDVERESTLDFMIEGALLTSSTRYAVEVVECGGAAGGATVAPRFPAADGLELGARTLGSLRVHIIPLQANGITPGTTDADLAIYRDGFLATYPVDSVEFTLGEVINISDDQDWVGMLDNLRYLRQSEQPDSEVYYYGMLRPTVDFRDYCAGGCIAGVGYVPVGFNGALDETGRVALGLTYDNEDSVDTMLHEVGHNHGRSHAPCVPPGSSIEGVDPDFPHPNAELGVYGYDIRTDSLIAPEQPDIMAYCMDPWFSDYTYNALIDAVAEVNEVLFTRSVDPKIVGSFAVLLVDPQRGARWGHPIPGPSSPSGQAEPATIFAADGSVVATVDVYRTAIAELDAFSIQVPGPQPGWHSVDVSGVGIVAF